MLKKLTAMAAAAALAGGLVAVSANDAEARSGRHAAFFGGLAVGTLAAGALSTRSYARYYDEGCYPGPMRCHWVPGACYRDRWGDLDCEPGYRSCRRALVCD